MKRKAVQIAVVIIKEASDAINMLLVLFPLLPFSLMVVLYINRRYITMTPSAEAPTPLPPLPPPPRHPLLPSPCKSINIGLDFAGPEQQRQGLLRNIRCKYSLQGLLTTKELSDEILDLCDVTTSPEVRYQTQHRLRDTSASTPSTLPGHRHRLIWRSGPSRHVHTLITTTQAM